MKYCLILLLIIVNPLLLISQQSDLFKILESQISAFNAHNIDFLTANLHEDFIWFSVTDSSMEKEVEGKVAFRKGMSTYFEQFSTVHSEIVDYTISGNKISFEEKVKWKGKSGEQSQVSLGVYEINDGKIRRAWYFY